ncbi:uncharacterized protein RJT21DRAFT_4242 [Scheffersomyces amazonensis]|uniref:uncharacterized protein n=1 Tax=Scheffersomyces amazonensis TaxID=1078765 RepID=UPI00315DB7B6
MKLILSLPHKQKAIILKKVKILYYLVVKVLLKKGILSPSTKKSFLLAYSYVILPKLIRKITSLILNGNYNEIFTTIRSILTRSLHFDKFPLFIAKLITILNLANFLLSPKIPNKLLLHLVSSFLAAILTYPSFQRHLIEKKDRYYTLDLTLTLVVRAVDALIFSPYFNEVGDAVLFILSSYVIMESWYFHPEKLTPDYRKWISSAADMDEDILQGFRYLNDGSVKYLNDTDTEEDVPKKQKYFEEFCIKYGKNPKLGDLSIQKKLPCEVVHCFTYENCERHALYRFMRSFKMSLKLYGSVNVLLWIMFRRFKMPLKYIKSTIRSAIFLASFSTLGWYGLCLVRKERLARLFPNVSQTTWDLLAPKVGGLLSGFSCFLEAPSRIKELSLFVAPRALGTFVSPEINDKNLFYESLAFSISFAILVAFAKEKPGRVRGLVGRALRIIFN